MPLPDEILKMLRRGKTVAAELPVAEPDMRAYVMVIPRAWMRFQRLPGHKHGWKGWAAVDGGMFNGEAAFASASRAGFEIRYIKHDADYTETDWGYDYDCVVADTTTRMTRVFVKHGGEVAEALSRWLGDLTTLRATDQFDSALVQNDVAVYLRYPRDYPHLWLDDPAYLGFLMGSAPQPEQHVPRGDRGQAFCGRRTYDIANAKPSLVWKVGDILRDQFGFDPMPEPVLGLDQVDATSTRGSQTLLLGWDCWIGFHVMADSAAEDALVDEMGDYLDSILASPEFAPYLDPPSAPAS